MKSKLLATFLVAIMLVTCLFTMTACGGLSDWLKDKDDKTDQTQTDDTNNDTNDDDDDDDDTPVVYSFATDSWATIAQVSASGKANEKYAVGDEKTVFLSTGEPITFLILGFNHDELATGTGKAGISIGMKNLLSLTYRMVSALEDGTWSTSLIRTETLPMVFEQLPEELQEVIKTVKKYTPLGSSVSFGSETTEDKLFLLSAREIMNTSNVNPSGAQYEYWKTIKDGTRVEDRVKKLGGFGADADWHYRTTFASNSIGYISSTGSNPSTNSITSPRGVNFGFCI